MHTPPQQTLSYSPFTPRRTIPPCTHTAHRQRKQQRTFKEKLLDTLAEAEMGHAAAGEAGSKPYTRQSPFQTST